MHDPFPFGLPMPTAWYLTLYVGTLVLHVVFMNYVLAGSAYLAIASFRRPDDEQGQPLADLLREWLPFMLSAAITAGVAPLLFVQILYQRAFYTANLLLFHRWMAILPALIVGFYALYLLKNWRWEERRWLRGIVGLVTLACFAFVGWSWTENHLLSLQTQQVWVQQYTSESLVYRSSQLLPRLGMWFCGSFAVLGVWLSWQLWWPRRPEARQDIPGTRRTSAMALAGLLTAGVCMGLYGMTLSAKPHAVLVSGFAAPYLAGAILSGGVQAYLWWRQYRTAEICPKRLTVLSLVTVLTVSCVAVLREAIRLAAVDLPALARQHAQASEIGGLTAFLAFLLVNTAGIVYCVRLLPSAADD